MVSIILHFQFAYWTDGNLDEEESDDKYFGGRIKETGLTQHRH
jgi:hypothetical protein